MHVDSYTYFYVESVDEILACYNSNRSYWTEISRGNAYCDAAQNGFESDDETPFK